VTQIVSAGGDKLGKVGLCSVFGDRRYGFSRAGVLDLQNDSEFGARAIGKREIGAGRNHIGAEMIVNLAERLLAVGVRRGEGQIQFHASDVFAGNDADLLAGGELRAQHFRHGGGHPLIVWFA
jgi:hypothetical protein